MTGDIKHRIIGNLGHITLCRPQALNALNFEMCEEILRLLMAWEHDPNIGAVLIDGEGERAFCAGGDVILLHDSGKAGDSRAENFWRTEYKMNALIQRYSKPYITLIDGFVMGGGVGLSVHGHYRIAGDNTRFAMPETGIGYFPDVGGTYFLPRLGMDVGQWIGLTGARLNAAQSCHLGVATHFVPTAQHGALINALGAEALDGHSKDVDAVLELFSQTPDGDGTPPKAVSAFGQENIPAIIAALQADGSEWALKQVKTLSRKSPLALCVTFEAIKRGQDLDFKTAMQGELDLSLNFLKSQDFYEGIRAQLIDKDRNPKWSHDDVSGVTAGQIDRLFRKSANPPQEFLT